MKGTSCSEEIAKILSSYKYISEEFGTFVAIHHVDITCDGCETEPIVGKRFKCGICQDRDLCESCFRNIIAARLQMAKDIGSFECMKDAEKYATNRKKMAAMLRSKEARDKWTARMAAVPCLSPSHKFQEVLEGPERAVVLSLPTATGNQERILEKFLVDFRPSIASCSHLAWISILSADGKIKKDTKMQRLDERVDAAVEYWDGLIQRNRKPESSDIELIANKFDIKRGKWLIFAHRNEVEIVWNSLAKTILQKAPALFTEIKVSTVSPIEEGHVICTYIEDYTKSSEMQEAADFLVCILKPLELRDRRLVFKPDIMTYLGIYKDNEYGIKPSIYSLKF